MKKIKFENGTLVSNAKVEIGGTIYDVTPEQYEGTTPLSASNMNAIQDNAEEAIDEVATTLEQLKTDVENKHTYSTEEQVIGTWIDGKPIYRKVIYSTINKSGTVSVQHGIANLGIVTNMYINFNRGDKQMINTRISTDGYDIGLDTIYADYFDIAIPTIFGSSIKYIYAIMEYTKTTD